MDLTTGEVGGRGEGVRMEVLDRFRVSCGVGLRERRAAVDVSCSAWKAGSMIDILTVCGLRGLRRLRAFKKL